MNQTAKRTAADIVNGYSEEELARIFLAVRRVEERTRNCKKYMQGACAEAD